MPWDNTPEKRAADAKVYGDPEYRRNRPLAMRRAGGKCELIDTGRACGSRDRAQVDHIVPVTQGGTHHLDNLRVLCWRHHAEKTAQEGGGFRSSGNRSRWRRREEDPPLAARTQW